MTDRNFDFKPDISGLKAKILLWLKGLFNRDSQPDNNQPEENNQQIQVIEQRKVVNVLRKIDLENYFIIPRDLKEPTIFRFEPNRAFDRVIFLSPTKSLEESLYIEESEDVDIDDTLLIQGIEAKYTQMIYLGTFKNLPPIILIAWTPRMSIAYLDALINDRAVSKQVGKAYEKVLVWTLNKVDELEIEITEKNERLLHSERRVQKYKAEWGKIRKKTIDKAREIPSDQMIVKKAMYYFLMGLSGFLIFMLTLGGLLIG